MYRFEVNCSRKEIEQLPTSPWLRTFKKHVLLFPVDRDTRAFFCRLQSNVFDAASLFQTNHVGTFECTRWSTFSHRVIKLLQFFVQCALWKEEMKKKSWRHTEKISSRGAFKCTTWLVWNKLVPSKTLLWRREKNPWVSRSTGKSSNLLHVFLHNLILNFACLIFALSFSREY